MTDVMEFNALTGEVIEREFTDQERAENEEREKKQVTPE